LHPLAAANINKKPPNVRTAVKRNKLRLLQRTICLFNLFF
jgi:hypothetical protein